MENTQLTQPENTQGILDPRRFGRNNSGLSESDISDVICILHPCSPAAFKIVASTAERSPQNVLQNYAFDSYDDRLTQSVLEEQETFILNGDGPSQALDLALRFSTITRRPELGFVFGRHQQQCDIVLLTDSGRRISNVHFRIFLNDSGVLMLGDMSTNGTIVDDVVLKGRAPHHPQTRMLVSGAVIQILAPNSDELIKFIVRVPSRTNHQLEFEERFHAHMHQKAAAEGQGRDTTQTGQAQRPPIQQRKTERTTQKAMLPVVSNQFGMYWNGGDKYNVVGQIGKGAFATVYQLATKSDGQLFAAKELEKRKFMKNGVLDRKLDNEMQIMKAASHRNIVQYVDYQDAGNHLYIIMEFVPCGDLQQYLTHNGALPEALGKRMAYQVLDALAYLHRKKITHRDIKPDNILLADLDPNSFLIKLSDFGLSKVVTDNETFLKTFCGTLLYCAPEVFPHYDAHVAGRKRPRHKQPQKFHSYSQSVDIWSFGAVLWFSLCLKPPFEGVADNTGRGMFEKIMGTPLEHGELAKQGISDDAVALLAAMLNTDPAIRPSPASCLRHKWFTGNDQPAVEGAVNLGLTAIAEDDELAEAEGHPDLSSLSLGEGESDKGDSQGSLESEVSIHSGDIAFFDPRQSKRFKSDAHSYREQDDMIDSSPELYHHIPIALQQDIQVQSRQMPRKAKLFGEISQSELNSSSALIARAYENDALDTNRSDYGDHYDDAQVQSEGQSQHNIRNYDESAVLPPTSVAGASPSLLGAESLVREMNMDSPHSAPSPGQEPNEPVTPSTPNVPQQTSAVPAKGTPLSDDTPRAPQQPTFSRQIILPIPASFYFEPDDPSTHNLEYASRVSGRDFSKSETSLPDTTAGSAAGSERHDSQRIEEPEPHSRIIELLPPVSDFLKPPPRLGRLVATADSFAPITLNLSSRRTTWGRAPSNTIVYTEGKETRVAKCALIVYFQASGIDKLPEHGDWLKLPDLHCVIATESRVGIWINGEPLTKGEPGKKNYGRVYTGDEVEVWPLRSDGKPGLKFTCEFYHGEAKSPRPSGYPRFKVETEGSSQKSQRSPSKPKEKEREDEKTEDEGVDPAGVDNDVGA